MKYICADCGLSGKAKVRAAFGGITKDVMLCDDCRESRLDRHDAAQRLNPPVCRACGNRPAVLANGRVNVLGYCPDCQAKAERKAWARRESMLKNGGLDIDPMAY